MDGHRTKRGLKHCRKF